MKCGEVRLELLIRDKYFQKVLRIIPTEGMKIDKDGLLIWVPELGAQEEEVERSSLEETVEAEEHEE